MKSKTTHTKRDIAVTLACIVFLLANLAAIGPRGRRHAKQALCLSNLRKWGLIFQQFAADNDGYFMAGWISDYHPPTDPNDYWMGALRPYYDNNHYLRCCPEAAIPGTEIGGAPWGGNGTSTAWGAFPGEVCGEPSPAWGPVIACDYGSYGINGWVCNPPLGDYYYPPNPRYYNWKTANVAGADNIPLFLDCQWLDGWPLHYDEPPLFEGQPWSEDWAYNSMPRYCINRHNGFVNSAFLDFSARKVGLKELWRIKWFRMFDLTYPLPDWETEAPWMKDFKDY